MTADMLERMAARTTKPVVTPTKTPPIDVDPDDLLGIGKIRSGGAAVNVPGNKPFTGPTLDPEVIAARAQLGQKAATAVSQGVDPTRVAAIQAGQGDPNRGFIGPAKTVGRFFKGIGSAITPDEILGVDVSNVLQPVGGAAAKAGGAVLRAATPALDKLDLGRRFVISAIQEVDDAIEGKGFSGKDFFEQGFAGTFGIGEKGQALGFGDLEEIRNIKNPYLNQLLGFTGDVLLDPVTWVTGAGGLAKTAGQRAIVKGGTKAATRFAKAEADNLSAALSKKIAEEALDAAVRVGDDASAETARQAIRAAEIKAAKAAKSIAGDTAARQIGRTANQALAESVVQVKDDAQRFLDQAEQIIGTPPRGTSVTALQRELDDAATAMERLGTGPLPGSVAEKVQAAGLNIDTFASEYASALATVEALTPQVIKNVQTSGLAGIAGSYIDILRGSRTAAQEVLGVRGGLRFTNPLSVFGDAFGPQRVMIPGTERAMNVAGKILADSRLGVGRTALGAAVLNNITPTGEGGILGSEDLLRLRTGLRGGRLTGAEAEDATRLLAVDARYRALVQNERKAAAGQLAESGIKDIDRQTLNSVIPYLQSDPATWAGRLPTMSAAQQAAYDAVKGQLDRYYAYAAAASGATGYVPPRRPNYFPQMQSQKALRWAERNPEKARDLASKLNVDRTWFLGNFRARELGAGDNWFGTKLTQADVDQGVVRLNQIAKDSGIIDFDFFETDVLEAMNRYANKHAQFSALQKTIGEIPETQPALAVRMPGGVRPQTVAGTSAPRLPGMPGRTYPPVAESLFYDDLIDPARLATATPDQLREVLRSAQSLVQRLNKPNVVKQSVIDDIDFLNARLEDIAATAATMPPGSVGVATDEVAKLVDNVVNEVKGARLDIEAIPPKRWVDYVDVVNNGFIELNQFTTPDIAARAEIAELFQNAARMGDEQFAKRVKQLTQDYTRFSKTYLTMRPGFHVRNAISTAYQFVAAGGNPVVGIQGAKLQAAVNEGLKKGRSVRSIAKQIVDEGKLVKVKGATTAEKAIARRQLIDNLEAAINYSGATGFGQFGEIAEELGVGRRGFLRTAAPIETPGLKQASSAVGAVADASRKTGTFIENQFRFGLMWDGIMKGLSPQEAAARVNKYLIDYSDYSKADRVARQVFPFWTFMSRNAPLQMEMMFTNPRAYAAYNSFRRNLEDRRTEEEGGPIIPRYERERGVFATEEEGFGALLPGNVIRPGLPFEGGGENVLSTLVTEPTKLLGNVNPLLRTPVEALITNKKFFSGGLVVPREQADNPTPARLKYLIREIASPVSPLRSILAFTPLPRRNEWLADVLGLKIDQDQANLQELQSLLNWTGIPLGNVRTEQQVRELESRAIEIGKLIDAKKARETKEREKQMETPSDVTLDPDDLLGIDSRRGTQP